MDGVEYVFQRVGRVGVIDDSRETVGRMNGLKPTIDTLERAHRDENLLGLLAEHHGSTIDG